MACGKNYFMSLQKIGLIVTIFHPVILSKEGEMAGQDTCCCCVTCHISFAFRRLACKYTLFCTQQKKSEAGIMLILSDGSICGTVASTWPVTELGGCMPSNKCIHHFCSGPISMFILRLTLASVTAQINQSWIKVKCFYLWNPFANIFPSCSTVKNNCCLQVKWEVGKNINRNSLM